MTETNRFIVALAETLHKNGLPAHRLENTMQQICRSLGKDVEFSVTPELLLISFSEGENNGVVMRKFSGTDLHIEKMVLLHRLINNCLNDPFTIQEAQTELARINQLPNRYSGWMDTLAIGISTSSAACLFGGSYPEILVSACIGLVIGLLFQSLRFFPNLGKLTVLFAAAFALFFARWMMQSLGVYSVEIATITGLILLIPGFTLSLSITELANGHAQSGTVRFSGAIVTFIMIGVGIGLGNYFAGMLPNVVVKNEWSPSPGWLSYIALLFVPAGFLVLFRARLSSYFLMLVACGIAYFSMQFYGQFELGPLTVFLASLTLGAITNLTGSFIKTPVTLMLVPGIILLVPGSIGFKSIEMLMNADTLNGLEGAFQTLVSAVSLTVGLLFANMLIPSGKAF
ncbi:MAG: hypothetical protein RL264_800 [Bacteroidota bacterium]|jgi:uncharacterized membrane protein YjjP (DUF1212 family)